MMRVSRGGAGCLLACMVGVIVGCAFHPPLLLGRAESESLPGLGTAHLTEVLVNDMLNSEQIEHEIRTAFMIAAARSGTRSSSETGGTVPGAQHGTTTGPDVVIRLDRRPYTRGMRRWHILTLTLRATHSGQGAVAVVNRRVNDSTPSFVVIRDMTSQALRRALRKLR